MYHGGHRDMKKSSSTIVECLGEGQFRRVYRARKVANNHSTEDDAAKPGRLDSLWPVGQSGSSRRGPTPACPGRVTELSRRAKEQMVLGKGNHVYKGEGARK